MEFGKSFVKKIFVYCIDFTGVGNTKKKWSRLPGPHLQKAMFIHQLFNTEVGYFDPATMHYTC